MQVILNEDVAHLGEVGDIVDVADGYGRNFLIPRKLAMPATSRNVKELEHTKRQIAAKRAKMMKSAAEVAARLADVSLMISKAVGEEDKLFGSVTNRDIAEAYAAEGFEIDRRQIELEDHIRSLGLFQVPVKLERGVYATVKVFVVGDN